RARSLQSRVSSVLAGALTILLGVWALTWYYANAFTRPKRARDSAQAAAARRAQGEMPLPLLGRIDPPQSEAVAVPGVVVASALEAQPVAPVTAPATADAAPVVGAAASVGGTSTTRTAPAPGSVTSASRV